MKEIKLGTELIKEYTVKENMTAIKVGSGDVEVLATPMMIAFMENCASECLKQFLDTQETSVGTMINSTHTAPTPVNMNVIIKAKITQVDGKKVTFEIVANDKIEKIGVATHNRFILNKEKFEKKCKSK